MLLCVPIKKKTLSTLLTDLKKAQKIGNIIEIWFDELALAPEDIQKIFRLKKKPFIYKISKTPNTQILKKVDYVDIDIAAPVSFFKKIPQKTQLIISYHNLKETPATKELRNIAGKISKKGADIIKIATLANNFTDSLRMLDLLSQISARQKAICLCMGKDGAITRLTGHLFGNYLMYAPLSLSGKTAAGQIPAKKLKSTTIKPESLQCVIFRDSLRP